MNSVHEDLHSMVKVEVHEDEATSNEACSPPPPSNSAPPLQITTTPPPSTSGGLPNLSRIPNMPPLHLPAGRSAPAAAASSALQAQQQQGQSPEQMMLSHTAEMLAKQNMFCFGDVSVAEHPDAPPVPMVIPMVYLYPLPASSKGKFDEH